MTLTLLLGYAGVVTVGYGITTKRYENINIVVNTPAPLPINVQSPELYPQPSTIEQTPPSPSNQDVPIPETPPPLSDEKAPPTNTPTISPSPGG